MGKREDATVVEGMYALYQQGMSLDQVGKAYGRSRQVVYTMFVRRGLPRRTKVFQETVQYDGISYSLEKHGYYRQTRGDRRFLHQVVWEKHYGPVPEGYEIHHKDEDKMNNNEGNVVLLKHEEHTRLHHPRQPIPKVLCAWCGNSLTKKEYPCGASSGPGYVSKRLYCSPQCAGKHRAGKKPGFTVRNNEGDID